MNQSTLLEAQNLVRSYPSSRRLFGKPRMINAVNGVSLSLRQGQTLGLVGESGCGKSTTGRLLVGLEESSAGTVRFDGRDLPQVSDSRWRKLRTEIQMVFQDPLGALDRRWTIGDQIAEPLHIHDIGPKAARQERVHDLMRDVGLRPDQASRYPHELSGGQRQRVVLARALASAPKLLVCDEPVSALDVSIQAQVINLLTELQARRQLAIVFISHDLRVVRQISHRVAVMYLGEIVEEGLPDDVLQAPKHPYTKALVSAVPQVGHRPNRIVLQGDPPNPADRPNGCAFHPRCPMAQPVCSRLAPKLRPTGIDRIVACHFAEPQSARQA